MKQLANEGQVGICAYNLTVNEFPWRSCWSPCGFGILTAVSRCWFERLAEEVWLKLLKFIIHENLLEVTCLVDACWCSENRKETHVLQHSDQLSWLSIESVWYSADVIRWGDPGIDHQFPQQWLEEAVVWDGYGKACSDGPQYLGRSWNFLVMEASRRLYETWNHRDSLIRPNDWQVLTSFDGQATLGWMFCSGTGTHIKVFTLPGTEVHFSVNPCTFLGSPKIARCTHDIWHTWSTACRFEAVFSKRDALLCSSREGWPIFAHGHSVSINILANVSKLADWWSCCEDRDRPERISWATRGRNAVWDRKNFVILANDSSWLIV